MTLAADLIDSVLHDAVDQLRDAAPQIVTFALYFDHESSAISVCADTAENSARCVAKSNAFSLTYFNKAIEAGDLTQAALWQSNSGRSLSLGDFAFVNVARRDVPLQIINAAWFVCMAQSLMHSTDSILKICDKGRPTVFVVSSQDDEAGLVWCPDRHV